MALAKKKTTKAKSKTKAKTPQKKVVTEPVKTITKTVMPSMDDIILGAEPIAEEVQIFDVFNRHTFFEVENVEQQTKNTMAGNIVESLFGIDDIEEKEKLFEGAEMVEIKDRFHQKTLFIIRKV